MSTLRSALRSLLHSPRLSLAAIACIGLGAAATAAVATLVGARATAGLLYGIAPFDVLSFLGASAVLLAVALPAGWLPARRASSLEPMRALRA
jgi:ABC-type antimicrobial peptide transport system permease subunit